MSRRWGEIEAKPSMIWVQPPGTATMGHLFLDAYHATGDEYYYQAAEKVGGRPDPRPASQRRLELFHRLRRAGLDEALVRDDRQERLADGGIPALLRQRHVRRRRHVGGDAVPAPPLSREDAIRNIGPPLEQAIGFVLDSQYPNGGWPQRWPRRSRLSRPTPRYITFNDDVAAENIKFLIMVYQALGDDAGARCHPPRR